MSDTKPDLDAIEARANTAHDEVSRLCCGNDRGWRMSIPANDARDSDLIISAALNDVEALVAYARTLEAERDRARATAVHLEQELAQRLDHVRALHGGVHWCFNDDEQADVYEPGTKHWPCETRRVLDGDQRTEQP